MSTTGRGTARGLLALLVVVAAMVLTPYALLAGAFWMASDHWEFEGGPGVRYWLFVKGSRLERLGLVAPTDRAPRYTIAIQEGTFPGWNIVRYASTASPGEVAAAYADRCRSMGLKIIESTASADAAETNLTCEIELYLNVEMLATRKPEATSTAVWLRVWGSD